MNYDNPAGRLLEILKAGKKFPVHKSSIDAWFEILKTNNHTDMLCRLGVLMQLVKDTASIVLEEFPGEAEAVGHWSGQLKNAFIHYSLQSQWNDFIQHIDTHSLNYLASESSLLKLKANTKSLVDEDFEVIRAKLSEIYEELLTNSEIDSEVKKYLIRYLRKILTGIEDYFLTGALPVLEAVETAVGHANVDNKYKSFLLDTEFGKKILDTLAATANVVTVAVGLPQLTTAISMIAGGS